MGSYHPEIEWCILQCNVLGVNPLKRNDMVQKLIFLFWLSSIVGCIFFTILMVCYNEDILSVKNLSSLATNVLLFPHAIIKLSNLYLNKKAIGQLFNDSKDTFWRVDDYAENEEIKKSEWLLTFLRKLYVMLCLFSVISTAAKPFILGEGASAYQRYKPDFFPRYFFLVLETVAFSAALIAISCLDLVILVVLMMAKLQFTILNEKLKNLFNSVGDDKTEFKLILHNRLKDCVDQQNFLINFLDRYSSTFSGTTLYFLGVIILTMCVRMYIISNEVTKFNYRVEALFHLMAGLNQIIFCYSIPAQAIMDQADEISNSAYFSNWYEHPQEAKCVLQIMFREQKRVEITAGGFVMIDLKMFMAAVKTIISYCMFLRTMDLAKN